MGVADPWGPGNFRKQRLAVAKQQPKAAPAGGASATAAAAGTAGGAGATAGATGATATAGAPADGAGATPGAVPVIDLPKKNARRAGRPRCRAGQSAPGGSRMQPGTPKLILFMRIFSTFKENCCPLKSR